MRRGARPVCFRSNTKACKFRHPIVSQRTLKESTEMSCATAQAFVAVPFGELFLALILGLCSAKSLTQCSWVRMFVDHRPLTRTSSADVLTPSYLTLVCFEHAGALSCSSGLNVVGSDMLMSPSVHAFSESTTTLFRRQSIFL